MLIAAWSTPHSDSHQSHLLKVSHWGGKGNLAEEQIQNLSKFSERLGGADSEVISSYGMTAKYNGWRYFTVSARMFFYSRLQILGFCVRCMSGRLIQFKPHSVVIRFWR
jgi:hypothetical protein